MMPNINLQGIWLARLGIGTASENQSFLMDTSMLIFGGRKNEVVTVSIIFRFRSCIHVKSPNS